MKIRRPPAQADLGSVYPGRKLDQDELYHAIGSDLGDALRRVKVVFAGDSEVGKTSVASAISRAGLATGGPTVGVDFFVSGPDGTKAVIFDLAGQERFAPLAPLLSRGAKVAVLMFDVTRPKTLLSIPEWAQRLLTGQERVILVGNKFDLGLAVSPEDIAAVAAAVKAERVILTSASTGFGLEELKKALLEA